MNQFDEVFKAIKQHCGEKNSSLCFDKVTMILSELGETEPLQFYLDFLGDLGLIIFDEEKDTIALTDRGKYTNSIFSST